MKIIIIALIGMTIFSSCKLTEKKAKKEVMRIATEFPHVLAKPCATLFPVRESEKEVTRIIKGDTIIETDTLFVDCAEPKNVNKIVKLPCETKIVTDTVLKEKTIVKENTALADVLRQEIKKIEKNKVRNEIILGAISAMLLITLLIKILRK